MSYYIETTVAFDDIHYIIIKKSTEEGYNFLGKPKLGNDLA